MESQTDGLQTGAKTTPGEPNWSKNHPRCAKREQKPPPSGAKTTGFLFFAPWADLRSEQKIFHSGPKSDRKSPCPGFFCYEVGGMGVGGSGK